MFQHITLQCHPCINDNVFGHFFCWIILGYHSVCPSPSILFWDFFFFHIVFQICQIQYFIQYREHFVPFAVVHINSMPFCLTIIYTLFCVGFQVTKQHDSILCHSACLALSLFVFILASNVWRLSSVRLNYPLICEKEEFICKKEESKTLKALICGNYF